ncbi:MAG: transposase [Methanoregula sp.]
MTAEDIRNCTAIPRIFLEGNNYQQDFARGKRTDFHHVPNYVSGLITLPRESNMSQIACNIVDSGSYRALSHFISTSEWNHEEVMKLTRSAAIKLLGPGGSIIFDETGQQKYGPDSVGVSIQYLGVIGDTCAAQGGVFASYCLDNVSALIDYRLFLTESWINNHKNAFLFDTASLQRQANVQIKQVSCCTGISSGSRHLG